MKTIVYFIIMILGILFVVPQTFSYTKPYHIPFMTDDGGGISGVGDVRYVKVEGSQLLVDFDRDGVYEPYFIKGVAYAPTPIGRFYSDWGWPAGDPRINNILDDPAILNRDFSLLQQMKANTIRIWAGSDVEVTLEEVQNPCSPWYHRWENIGSFKIKLTQTTLDLAQSYGLKVIAGFQIYTPGPWCDGSSIQYNPPAFLDPTNPCYTERRTKLINDFRKYVNQFKNHPAILFWALGNENNLSIPSDYAAAWYSLVNELAQVAHEAEGSSYHPVAVVNGDLRYIGDAESGASDSQMTYLDIWGINAYRGNTFGSLFSDYTSKSNKPLWISEYGVDAWHTTEFITRDDEWQDGYAGYVDQTTQAQWDSMLWDEAVLNNNVAIGATVMAYSDEWWKPYEWICDDLDGDGSCDQFFYSTQEHFGWGATDTSCPKDGVPDYVPAFPDQFINDEWLGIMSISRPVPDNKEPDVMTPKQVYSSLQNRFTCPAQAPFYAGVDNNKSCDDSQACCDSSSLKAKNGYCVFSCGIVRPPIKRDPPRPVIFPDL